MLHRKCSNSKSADDEARHVQAEFEERENSRNTISMESNPLRRDRAGSHENWSISAAAGGDLPVSTAVYVNQAFEPPSTNGNGNVVRLRAGGHRNQLAKNPTTSGNSAQMCVYVEADPNQPVTNDTAKSFVTSVYSEAQDGTVPFYENHFARPTAAPASKQQNYEDFNLIFDGTCVEMKGAVEGGANKAGSAGGAGGVGDASKGAHHYENHAPVYPSVVYAVAAEVPTEYNSDYQIPDALIVEGVNLDYADLNNHQTLYDSSA